MRSIARCELPIDAVLFIMFTLVMDGLASAMALTLRALPAMYAACCRIRRPMQGEPAPAA